MRPTPARVLAAGVVERVLRDEAWTSGVLDAALNDAHLDRRESAFATRLAYGAVEMMPTLDAAVRERADRPGRIRPRVMAALCVSAYELLMLDTPTAVAVDQGVALVKARDSHASGFANAVLRKLAEDAPTFPWGDPAADTKAASRMSGFGSNLVARVVADLGEDAARELMRGSVGPPPLYLAANPLKSSCDEIISVLAGLECPTAAHEPGDCIECFEPALALRSGLLEDGRAITADRGAQVVASLVPLSAGARVLDVASGRGTKTALMGMRAARAGLPVRIDAVDLHEWKSGVLVSRMELLGITGVETHTVDAADPDALEAKVGAGFDAALVDAPCTNLGTLRRHPERRWRYADDDPARLAALGLRILSGVARLVRPGGFVVYSTCTVLPIENGSLVETFLSEGVGTGYRVVGLADRVPADLMRFVTGDGYFESKPEAGGPDGHFAVLLEHVGTHASEGGDRCAPPV